MVPWFQLTSGHLSGRGRVDISAEQSLAEDRKDAALGLLAGGGADIDEVVDGGGGGWCYEYVSGL